MVLRAKLNADVDAGEKRIIKNLLNDQIILTIWNKMLLFREESTIFSLFSTIEK